MTNNVFVKKNKVAHWIKVVALSIVIGMVVTFAVALLAGFKVKFVVTSSMEPTYKTKSCIILLAPCDYYEDVEINDVVTWGAGATTFTHRVVGSKEVEVNGETRTYWIARGDNPTIALDNTQTVSPDVFVGKVVYHSNVIGAIFNYIKENIMLVAFCLVVIFLVCVIVL